MKTTNTDCEVQRFLVAQKRRVGRPNVALFDVRAGILNLAGTSATITRHLSLNCLTRESYGNLQLFVRVRI
jgi:hypothetical protein